MAILITGGAGYIGSSTCIELLQAGEEIVVADNFSNSKPAALDRIREITGKEFKFYKADMRCGEELERIFEENEISEAIHFAGLKAVGESVQKPLMYYDNNVSGTVNLLKIMCAHGVKRIVFSSSATVYGEPKSVPIKEDFPLSTTNPYGSTKLMIEDILRDLYFADGEFSAALLRYFNPIGAHESGRIGENPNGIPNNIMPRLLNVALGKQPYMTVFGDDYPTKDGTGVRDYLHVTDLAAGHLAAVKWVRRNKGAEAFNLGTGTGYSVLDIIHALEKAAGRKIPYKVTPRRPGDVPECYADPTKALRVLGWKAQKNLADMCADAWNFARNNPDGL